MYELKPGFRSIKFALCSPCLSAFQYVMTFWGSRHSLYSYYHSSSNIYYFNVLVMTWKLQGNISTANFNFCQFFRWLWASSSSVESCWSTSVTSSGPPWGEAAKKPPYPPPAHHQPSEHRRKMAATPSQIMLNRYLWKRQKMKKQIRFNYNLFKIIMYFGIKSR